VVTLNNIQVLRPNDFNQQVGQITRAVTVRTTNTLKVEVRSQPGSGFTLTIVRGGSSNCPTVNNRPPVANAGPDQSVAVNTTVTLDGSQSSDPDGNPLIYKWSILSKPAGSTAALSSPTAVRPTLLIDKPGQYLLQLLVNDGQVNSAPAQVQISTVNSKPVAAAGADQSGPLTTIITLDGSASTDVDGDPLTYSWTLTPPTGSTATLSSATAVKPTFTIDKPGTYTAQLVVNDGTVNSDPDTVVISTQNSKPVANAGPDQSATVTSTVTLDGSGSTDVDGNSLTYQWSLTVPASSTATLSSVTAVMPTFVLDKPGTYTAQLIVNDGTVNSDEDTVVITTENSKPVADAGDDQTVPLNSVVNLNGGDSSDVDGDILTYRWTLLSKPSDSTASLTDDTTATPSFTADKPGTYTIQLIVKDGTVDSDPDTVVISTQNSKPVADAGGDQSGTVNQLVTLDGSGSTDADNDPLTYQWSFTSTPTGSTATITSPTAQNPTFTPDLPGLYVAQVIVRDGKEDSLPDTVSITINPVTPVNNPPTIISTAITAATVGQVYSYDVNATDPDAGDVLTYSLTTFPTGMTITVSTGLIAWTPTSGQTGPQNVTVQVSDGHPGGTDTQSFTVTVSAAPPVNNPPTITSTAITTAQVGQAYSYDVNATDPDAGDTLTYALTTKPTGMTIAATTGVIAWTPAANQTGAQDVIVQVSDGNGGTATQSFTVTVTVANPNNMAPRAQANSYTIRADQTLTVPASGVLGNDSDPENDPITARKLTDPTRGALGFNADGSFSFTPSAATQTCSTPPPPAAGISFTEPLGIESNFPNILAASVRGLAKGDFNQDGFLDLAVTGQPALGGALGRIWLTLGKGDGTFQAPVVLQNFAADARPSGILAKDVDGDCKLDLFVAVELARQVLFFKGRGDGTFDASVPTALTQSPAGLQSADVNDDGKLDLVTLNSFLSNENSVSVLLGNGNGTFQSPVNYPAGIQLSDLALGDVNGDRAPDIVVSSSVGSSNLSVLRNTNTGSGAFAAAQPFPVKMSVSSLYLADFNRDTKLDVVLGGALCEWTGPNPSGEPLSPVTGCMTFIPGTGDGTFSVPLSVPLTRSPFTTAMANRANRGQYGENVAPDVNGDGILDVVFGGGEVVGNLLHVRLGNGDGTFSTTAWVVSPGAAVGVQPLSVPFPDAAGATGSVVIDDFTGDGMMDIATAHAGSNSPGRVALLPGTTPGKFASPRIFPVLEPPFTGGSFSGGNAVPLYPMTLGDFTDDGQPELAVLGVFNRVGLMPLASDGSLGPVQTGIFVGGSQPNAVQILSADFDRDGNLDVVWRSVGSLTVAYGNGAGQFTNPVFILPLTGAGFFNIVLGDFNSDGFPDVAAYTGSSSVPLAIDVYLSTGGGRSFTLVHGSARAPLFVNSVQGMVSADFDQDGVLDVVFSEGFHLTNQTIGVQHSVYLRGTGDGTFQPAVVIASGIQGGFVDYAAADVNHDDKLDLIGIAVFSAVHVQLGNGDGTFQAPVLYNAYHAGGFGTLGQVVLADFDWDGHLDVALTTPGTRLSVLRGLGDGTFTAAQKFAAGNSERTDSSLLVADVNTDGRPDLIVGGRSFYAQDFTVLLNNSATLGACVYRDSFTYAASDGSLDSPPVTVRITIQPVNHPPVITSAPVTSANTGQLYTYDVNAIDQDAGERLAYALATAPSGMTIAPDTGLIQWLPASNQAGANSVKVRVYDSSGVFAEQNFTLTVTQRVTVPNVVGQTQATAQTTITGAGLTVGTIASRYSPTIPAGTVISQTPLAGVSVAQNSAVSFVVSLGPLVVPGLVSITVSPSNPVILVSGTQAFTATGVLSGGGTVDVSEGVTWSSGTTTVATINSFGVATGVAAGTSTISATLGAITGSTTLNVRARVTGDITLPAAAITTPADGAEVTSPIDVIGTATDANFFRYELSYALAGETDFTLLAGGSTAVTNGVLGQFEPTLLINDLYDLKLTVFDLGGNQSEATVTVQVARELKVGLFTITFQDLNIPLSGIPITINRTYDSRDKGKGDFGIGWRLDIQTLRIRPNREQGSGWVVNHPGGALGAFSLARVGDHKVSLTLPGGKVEVFDMVVNPSVSPLVPLQTTTASYIPRAGTLGSLLSLSDNDLLVVGNQPGDITLTTFNGDTYNPKLFTYITADGTRIDIDRTKGVEKVQDLNGNALTFGPTGILHSSGKSVPFTRDAQGRITQITDPSGNSRSYTYNASSDLITATDFVGNATRFTYNSTHGLLDIIDPTGARVARNEYDPNGRLIATIDANGNRIEFTHNLNIQQELVRDRLGNITLFEYDTVGNVVAKTDALGGRTTYTHDSRGNELSVTDPLGRVATKTYAAANNVLTSTDFDGNTTTSTYNARQQVLTTRDPEGRTTTNVYDANGNLTQTTNPEGGVTRHTYTAAGNRLTTTDPLGNMTTFTYDASGNLTSATDPLGTVTTLTYNANGGVLSTTKAGRTTQFQYDGAQRLTRSTNALGHQSLITYSPLGDGQKVASTTDANGGVTQLTYNVSGKETGSTFPDGSAQAKTYDAENRVLSQTDRDGHTTAFQYDAVGRQTKITNPDGTTILRTYDAVGRQLSQTDERGNVTTYIHAPNRQTVMDALGNVTVHEFDSARRTIKTTDALGRTTTFAYDSTGALSRTTFPDGSSKTTTYNSARQKTAETDQAGSALQFAYDAAGRMIRVTNAAGGITTYTYDALGNRISETDANGHATQLQYDTVGRLTRRTRPLGQQESFTYDAVGNQITHTDFNSQIATFTYNAVNRQTAKNVPGSGVVNYAYTGSGLRTQAGGDSYTYDVRGRLTQETKAIGGVLSYTYDAAGNKTSLTTPQGAISYTYDALNRLATVVDTTGTTTYTYDAVGNLTGTAYPNGNTTTYTYDTLNRLTQMSNSGPAGLISSYTYTLGAAGNRLQVVEAGPATTGRTVSYTYDAVYRLTQEAIDEPGTANDQTITYSYDAVGNRTQMNRAGVITTYTYDNNDRLVTEASSAGTFTSTYDANGNLKTRGNGTATDAYTYDGENRLISASVQTGTNPGPVSYTYDADGMRTSKTTGGVTTTFLLDKNLKYAQVVVETAGATIATYTHGNQLISQTRTGVGTRFYLTDGQLSTRQLTTAAGLVSDTYTYDAFGVTLDSTGTTPNVYLYTGEQLDANVGFYYLRARYYAQALGRFITIDPEQGNIFDPVSLHRYLYANANPVTNWDPSGRSLAELLVSFAIRSFQFGSFVAVLDATALIFLKGEKNIHKVIHEAIISGLVAGPIIAAGGGLFVLGMANLMKNLYFLSHERDVTDHDVFDQIVLQVFSGSLASFGGIGAFAFKGVTKEFAEVFVMVFHAVFGGVGLAVEKIKKPTGTIVLKQAHKPK
jgi:RHS repeat-associated protein